MRRQVEALARAQYKGVYSFEGEKRWHPEIVSKRPHKVGNHRALGDIRESVSELRYYRERAFIARPTPPTPS